MTYFNPDEEVLNIELTPYGKYLFSQGKFRPAKYSFSDEDVVYNVAQMSGSSTFTEEQNTANTRIIQDTPYTKPTPRKVQVVSKDIMPDNMLDTQQEMYIGTQRSYINSLGNAKYDTSLAPKMKLSVLNGEKITNIDLALQPQHLTTGSLQTGGHPDLAIPQVDIDFIVRTSIVSAERPEKVFMTEEAPIFINGVPTNPGITLKDGGSVVKQNNEFYFLIEEDNTHNMLDSFSLEVYEVMPEIDEYTKANKLRQLMFFKDREELAVKDNILLPDEEVLPILEQLNTMLFQEEGTISTNVSSYINIFTDYYEEISEDLICEYINGLRNNGFALDTTIQCPDKLPINQIAYDIYATDGIISDEC